MNGLLFYFHSNQGLSAMAHSIALIMIRHWMKILTPLEMRYQQLQEDQQRHYRHHNQHNHHSYHRIQNLRKHQTIHSRVKVDKRTYYKSRHHQMRLCNIIKSKRSTDTNRECGGSSRTHTYANKHMGNKQRRDSNVDNTNEEKRDINKSSDCNESCTLAPWTADINRANVSDRLNVFTEKSLPKYTTKVNQISLDKHHCENTVSSNSDPIVAAVAAILSAADLIRQLRTDCEAWQ